MPVKKKKKENSILYFSNGGSYLYWEKVRLSHLKFPKGFCSLYPLKLSFKKKKKLEAGNFLGSPVVKTSPFSAGGVDLISGQEAKIPHASWPKNQNIKNSINTL